MYNHFRHRRAVALLAVSALVVSLITLLSVTMADTDDGPPRCPASRSGAVDLVPPGVRPCVLYGAGSGVTTDYDSHTGSTPRPGSTGNQTSAPKQTTGPKVPAAPKPAAPAPRPAAPRR